jgi:hypothetical protein
VARWFRSMFVFPVARPFVCGCHTISTMLRFHTPLVEPCRRISRTRLSDKAPHLRGPRRLAGRDDAMDPGTSLPLSEFVGFRQSPGIRSLRPPALNSGPFPPPALPGLIGTTNPSATPCGPASPSRVSGWGSRAPTAWVSRVSLDLRVPACRRHYPGGPLVRIALGSAYSNRYPAYQRLRPSPSLCWVGVHIGRFEACSTFTRVTACRFAASPCDTCFSKAPTASLPPPPLR